MIKNKLIFTFLLHAIGILGIVLLSSSCKKDTGNTVEPYIVDTTKNVSWSLVFQDNFDSTALNPSSWYIYNGAGHAGNGLRSPSAVSVANGILTITAQMVNNQLVSAGIANTSNYQYGKFEFRVRADADSSGATSAVVLTWPQSEKWPDDGENDIFETYSDINPYRTFFETNILSGLPLNHWAKQIYNLDVKQWHVVSMEWDPTYIKIYADGVLMWSLMIKSWIPQVPHHLCIQLDAFKTIMTGSTRMQVDWVKIYKRVVN